MFLPGLSCPVLCRAVSLVSLLKSRGGATVLYAQNGDFHIIYRCDTDTDTLNERETLRQADRG